MKKRNLIFTFALLGTLLVSGCEKNKEEQNLPKEESKEVVEKELSLNFSSYTIKENQTFTLVPSYEGYTGNYLWFTDAPSVATVLDGVVTGVQRGTAEISVLTDDGKMANCIVTVVEKDKLVLTYSVNYYFENLEGNFIVDSSLSYESTVEEGTKISINTPTVSGFTFDENNENNRTSGVVSESRKSFAAYYLRNSYNITVYGGISSKNNAKYEEIVDIVSNYDDSQIVLNSGENAVLNSNKLTVGTSDVILSCLLDNDKIFNSSVLLSANNCSGSFKMDVHSNSNIMGGIFGYNSANTSEDGIERFYLLAVKNNRLSFYESVSGNFTLIAEDTNSIKNGTHTFGFSILNDYSIDCSVDGYTKFKVTVAQINGKGCKSIATPGRIAMYSQNKAFDVYNLTALSGQMTLAQAKTYYVKAANTFHYNRFDFSSVDFSTTEGVDLTLNCENLSISSKEATERKNRINSATCLDEIEKALDGSLALKMKALKDYTISTTYAMLDKIHAVTLGFRANAHIAKYADADNCLIYYDYKADDNRWWTPRVYKLRNAGQVCLLDKFDEDLNNAKNLTDLYKITAKYSLDLVRALAYKDLDFYYWSQKATEGTTVFDEWWYLWTYHGAAGQDFEYCGTVFEDYVHTEDYRIAAAFFKKGTAPTNIKATIESFFWMINYQTVDKDSFIVTLITDGGFVESTTLYGPEGSSGAYTPVKLPIPTREGYEFDGWYPSRLYGGTKYANNEVPVNTKYDVTLYAAWKKDGVRVNSDVVPASYITENMVIQQKKPIVLSGTGKEGVEVSATVLGTTKTSTVIDGKWSITFDGQDATFTPFDITISGGEASYVFKNCLIGEVWVTTGQSNMDMLPVWLNGRGNDYAGKMGDIPNLDKVRVFRQFIDTDPSDDQYNQERWCVTLSGEDLFDKSMLSVYFASAIQSKLNVPVGVVNSSRGGTYIEEWLSEENVSATYNTIPEADQSALTSRYYHCMTLDLAGLNCSGVVWYQGENNWANPNEYKEQYKKLVEQYRTLFNDDDLPIIAQQLVQYGYLDFSEMRLAQWEVAKEINNAYCSCSIDTGEKEDIHPADKLTLGNRMGAIALEKVYGIGSDSLSYAPVSAIRSEGKIIISFENEKTINSSIENLKHFSVTLEDYSVKEVEATLVDNTIVIDDVMNAISVNYACKDWLGEITLYGGNGLPVTPFRITISK